MRKNIFTKIAAAKLAHCDEFAEKLSDGWNTMIGENGCELSGGERQRISIARAFLKDAPVILLDEATASLDVDNETMIQESLSQTYKEQDSNDNSPQNENSSRRRQNSSIKRW